VSAEASYRCSKAGVWLPRVLAAATLIAAVLISMRIDDSVIGNASYARGALAAAGGFLGLVIIRTGAWAGAIYRLRDDALEICFSAKDRRELPFEQINSLTYDVPFARRRQWLPAMILVDRFGVAWRVPSILNHGDQFVRDLLAACGRDDLASFASAHRLEARMARYARRVQFGYGLALLIVIAATLYSTLGVPG